MTTRERNILRAGIPKDLIKTRSGGGGKKLSYIEAPVVINRFDAAFNTWDFIILETKIHDIGNDKKEIVVLATIDVTSEDGTESSKAQFGSVQTSGGMNIGDATKGAASDALKKCASLYGVGIQLYGDEHYQPPTMDQNIKDALQSKASTLKLDPKVLVTKFREDTGQKMTESQPSDILVWLGNVTLPDSAYQRPDKGRTE